MNFIKYLANLLNALLGKEPKPTLNVPTEWLANSGQQTIQETRTQHRKVIQLPELPKIVFPKISFKMTWLKGMRILAVILVMIDFIALLTSLSGLESAGIGIFFGIHMFVLLYFLYKTKQRLLFQKFKEDKS